MTDISNTLKERGKTHGDYPTQAMTSQGFKHVMHTAPGWQKLNGAQRESLEMFAVKMSRILNGDPNHHDSWHDIAGYATLVADTLEG